jgi:hypothetical protein
MADSRFARDVRPACPRAFLQSPKRHEEMLDSRICAADNRLVRA